MVRSRRTKIAGEEKTRLKFPKGYGYAYRKTDHWILNYMIHNLTDAPTRVWITYDVDFIPATAPQAKNMRAARPIWMDVMNGSIYPVYDALRGMGKKGRYTFPSQAKHPYAGGWKRNQEVHMIFRSAYPHNGNSVVFTDAYGV